MSKEDWNIYGSFLDSIVDKRVKWEEYREDIRQECRLWLLENTNPLSKKYIRKRVWGIMINYYYTELKNASSLPLESIFRFSGTQREALLNLLSYRQNYADDLTYRAECDRISQLEDMEEER